MRKRAIIIGGNGQDATEMTIFLAKKKYKILSLLNKKSTNIIKNSFIKYKNCSLLNTSKLLLLIKSFKPHEIYNFAGITTIQESEKKILLNDKVNNYSYLALLESLRNIMFKGKLFHSLSAELFGDYNYKKLDFNKFNPLNPYAISKLSSYYYSKYFREKYGLKIYCGFFFNHDSKYNNGTHLIYNIVKNFKKISQKKKNFFKIQNIYSKRDWNLATDFIEKVWGEIAKKKPSDFVLRSGQYNNVEDVILNCAKFYNISLSKIEKKNQVIFLNSNTKKPIIYCYKEKEIIRDFKCQINDIKVLYKNKLFRIIKDINSQF